MSLSEQVLPEWTNLTDLAVETFGGQVLYATDDFFADKENLIKRDVPIFLPDKFVRTGKWMDGWETRRKRGEGHDYAIIRLGKPGQIVGVDVDTSHFSGNHPHQIKVEGLHFDQTGLSLEEELDAIKDSSKWETVISVNHTNPKYHNYFNSESTSVYTHVKYHMYPDGGTARLRVYGYVSVDPKTLMTGEPVDLALNTNGGVALYCSDEHFGKMKYLLQPFKGIHMGDGWETRRRRGVGFDWTIIRLGHKARIHKIVIDTAHFLGNYPDYVAVEGLLGEKDVDPRISLGWTTLVPKSKTEADQEHVFELDKHSNVIDHIRLMMYPDGGVSRIRVFGVPE